jgi:hypothetical protein
MKDEALVALQETGENPTPAEPGATPVGATDELPAIPTTLSI